MRPGFVAALIGGLGLLVSQSGSAWAAAPRLEHMSYANARKVILRHGWQPLAGGCGMMASAACGAYPEIGSCSGVSPGRCGMVFVQRKRCLYLGTTGGQPGDPASDTRVASVNFRPGPCSKAG